MPMPTRWTKEARQSILDMMQREVSREEIEVAVGRPFHEIWSRLEYHGRVEALERRRQVDQNYSHLKSTPSPTPRSAHPIQINAADSLDPVVSAVEQRAIDALYAPRVQIPEYIARMAERRRKYG